MMSRPLHVINHAFNLLLPLWALALVMILPCTGFAQQSAQTSLVMFNRYQVNPAYAGMDGSLSVTGGYRAQWLNIEGNPEQTSLNAHMPFYLWNGGIGIKIYGESIGAEKMITASLSYNYVLETDLGFFSIGAGAGIVQRSLDGALLRTPDGEYEGPTINHNDNQLPLSLERNTAPLLELGAYYAGAAFEGGISLTQWSPGNASLSSGFPYRSKPTVQAFGEYYIEQFDLVRIYPTVWVKSDFVQAQAEIAVRGVYQDFLQLGVGIRGSTNRIAEAVTVLAGLRLSPQFSIAYAYDFDVTAVRRATDGTHELVLRYNLGKVIGAGLPPRIIYNPRML